MALLRFCGVHLIFLTVAAVLIAWNSGWRPSLSKQSNVAQGAGSV